MLLGAHISSAGGIWNAPDNAAAIGCEGFQMFTRPPQGGPAPEITEDVVEKFQTAMRRHNFEWFCVHAPYYINFASSEIRIRDSSGRVVREELERASKIGASYVMAHLGSFKDLGRAEGMKMVINGLEKTLDEYNGATQFLIEISAGAGNVIGDTFENIAEIIHHARLEKYNIGVCFDTQHAFASGYDLRTKEVVEKTWTAAHQILGPNRIKMSHCNDSMVEFGTHKDRHAHIGAGHLGTQAFEHIFSHAGFNKINFMLEAQPDLVAQDLEVLKKIRASCSSKA